MLDVLPTATHGRAAHSHAQHTGASISVGHSLDKVGHHLHPASRSFHSQKAVYVRRKDGIVKAQPEGSAVLDNNENE